MMDEGLRSRVGRSVAMCDLGSVLSREGHAGARAQCDLQLQEQAVLCAP